jgi:hypothetical protein
MPPPVAQLVKKWAMASIAGHQARTLPQAQF